MAESTQPNTHSFNYLDLTSVSSGTTDLLDRRMAAWHSLCKTLVGYLKEVAACEELISKRINKLTESLTVIEEPSEGKQQFRSSEDNGVNRIISAVLQGDHARAQSHADAGSYITSTSLLSLRKLKSDIKRVLKDLHSEHNSLNMRFAKARENSKTCYRKLAVAVSETIDLSRLEGDDPWIIHHAFQRQLQKDIHEDNVYRTKVRASVGTICEFEATVMERIKAVLNDYIDWRTNQVGLERDELAIIKGCSARSLMIRSGVGSSLGKPTRSSLRPRARNPWLKPRLAPSNTHSREAHMVVTATGFLYLFPDGSILDQKSPDFSLNLRHCHLHSLKGDLEFDVSGKQLDSLFSSERRHHFRAKSAEDRARWVGAIRKWAVDSSPPPEPHPAPVSPTVNAEHQAKPGLPIPEPAPEAALTESKAAPPAPEVTSEASSEPKVVPSAPEVPPKPSAEPKAAPSAPEVAPKVTPAEPKAVPSVPEAAPKVTPAEPKAVPSAPEAAPKVTPAEPKAVPSAPEAAPKVTPAEPKAVPSAPEAAPKVTPAEPKAVPSAPEAAPKVTPAEPKAVPSAPEAAPKVTSAAEPKAHLIPEAAWLSPT
ncbi:hypothetical protein L0F63_005267 [Massospora cicadina]|nr:hypothetical protein L0F63_005267 [Massospora cicadina]